MTRELYVTSTPHESKVGLVEDDLLAEIYLERENEYTLAGSIYKGRVTRVLPGMQSAFVDIGLERDAFLYVSDFMELQEDEEVEDIPTNRPVQQQSSQPRAEASSVAVSPALEHESAPENRTEAEPHSQDNHSQPKSADRGEGRSEGRNDWRNRRRRGRRGERMPESKFARPAAPAEPPSRSDRVSRDDYGPPPGYQPILLPGESISKYQRAGQARGAAAGAGQSVSADRDVKPLPGSFQDDEPLFAVAQTEPSKIETSEAPQSPHRNQPQAIAAEPVVPEVGTEEWDREQRRQHERNVASVFGETVIEEHTRELAHNPEIVPEHSEQRTVVASAGTMEEEEIEDDEADLVSYIEDMEDDAFEEMEEETHAAGHHDDSQVHEIAASTEVTTQTLPSFADDNSVHDAVEVAATEEVVDEVAEEEAEEAEIEEAQAEAEALLDAEARGNGTVDARVEVRSAAGTAAYTQPTPRPGTDRRGPRGRRGGGRRFRKQEPQQLPQITDLLKEGQEILVQIAKEPIGKKGARITSHIALPGRFLVYMPTVNHTGVSRKIASEEERQRLKRIIISERENGHGGFIVRTAAQGANEEELRADIRFLKNLWNEIKTRSESGKSPALIYHDLNVVERILRDQVTSDFSAIWVDTEQEYERILRFANRFQPALVKRVKLYTKETPLFEQFGLNEEINKALKAKVWLKSGGYIVINQTEALVAIDINTGKYVGKTARLEDTIVKTNVDAIKEIVRQIRLRDLGGIIIIDFIDMDERRNRQKVMQALEEALRSDRSPSKVLQFNDFGLVAITRKRVKQSLERTIGSPCPYCEATGFVKSVSTICDEIYVEMRKIAKHLEHSDVILRVNPEVAKILKSGGGKLLNEMEELTKKTVIIKSDPALHQEKFDIN
jgi:Rne/Rng family ribonuclease